MLPAPLAGSPNSSLVSGPEQGPIEPSSNPLEDVLVPPEDLEEFRPQSTPGSFHPLPLSDCEVTDALEPLSIRASGPNSTRQPDVRADPAVGEGSTDESILPGHAPPPRADTPLGSTPIFRHALHWLRAVIVGIAALNPVIVLLIGSLEYPLSSRSTVPVSRYFHSNYRRQLYFFIPIVGLVITFLSVSTKDPANAYAKPPAGDGAMATPLWILSRD